MITEEQINEILLNSPMVLPNSPAGAGLKGPVVKEHFYRFIRVLARVVSEHLNAVKRGAQAELGAHNEGQSAHEDIRMVISDLITRDTELGNLIKSSISEHDSSQSAHSSLYLWLKQLQDKIESVSNLAQGKSKIIPVNDVYEMMSKLSPELNVGDKFVLATENVPDFTLFEKNSVRADAIELSHLSLMMGLELLPAKSYICSGYLLVATESGIDTTLFAKQAELERIESELSKKQNAFERLSEATEQIEVRDSAVHTLGLRARLTLVLPSEMENGFYSVVCFRSGAEPTSFISNGIIFTQDDSVEGSLVPVSNRIYELHIRKIEGVVLCTVVATDFEEINE